MNYLAHAYLSFEHPQILVGNMISDFVKGNKKFDYPLLIQKGIALHRNLDAYTDMHEATKEAKEIFRPAYRLYCGAFVDVVYDHFLANDENEFPSDDLKKFSSFAYEILYEHQNFLPQRFHIMLPNMREQDWLYHYRFMWGTQQSFKGLVYRTKYLNDSTAANYLLELHYEKLKILYQNFFTDVKQYAQKEFLKLFDL